MSEKMRYWVWLNSIPRISAKKLNQLLEYFSDPENVWNASKMELTKVPFLTPVIISQLTDKKFRVEVERHLEEIYKYDIKIITIKDRLYPEYLKNIYDPPIVLYTRGVFIKDEKNIAVVGSRKATSYGLKMAETLSAELSKYGIVVVSGMARGIDSHAHNGALNAGGRTIAVLGCGLDDAYPPENKRLMEKIINSGAVVSEYLPGVPPLPFNFPARNRIISGFSLGVVVIEASEHSGSLITANFALEQGREVFAIPGNLTSLNSQGTNKLIKDGAKMVMGIEDILEEIKIFADTNNNKDFKCRNTAMEKIIAGLDNEEKTIAEKLKTEPLHIDILAEKSGLSMQIVNSLLIMLELRGIVEQMPGKIFRLKQ